MQDVADREARELCDRLKSLGFYAIRTRGWAYRSALPWVVSSCVMIKVRWGDAEVTVEHPDNVSLYADMTARSVAKILLGAYSDESYRADRQRERTLPPPTEGANLKRNRVDRRVRIFGGVESVEGSLDLDQALKP